MFFREFVFGIFLAIAGGVLGSFAQLYLLVVVTAAMLIASLLVALIDNHPQRKSDGLSFLFSSVCMAFCALIPMWIVYLIR